MAAPWENDPIAQPQPQQGAAFPGVIQGKPKTPSPVEEERLDIARSGEERAERADKRGAVGEQQAYTLVSRVGGGLQDIRDIYEIFPDSKDAPSLGDAVLYGSFGPNSVVTRGLAGEGRVALEDAQRDMIDALLTLGTGAAYTDEQLETYRASYFPQFNDNPQQMELKRRRLARAFEEAIPRAGPLAGRLEQYRSALIGNPTELREATAQDEAPVGYRSKLDNDLGFGDDDAFDRTRALQERFGIAPEGETRLIGLLNANRGNPNLTMESLRQIYTDAGVPMPDEAGMQDLLSQMREENRLPASAIDTSGLREEYVRGLDTIIDRAGFNPEAQSETLGTSTRQGATLEGYDELVGIGNAIAEGLQGNNIIEGYRTGRDVTRRLDERGAAANPATNIAGRVTGGIVTAGTGAGAVRTAGQAAKVGAVEGGITGFNAGEGAGGSALGLAIGAPTGAALGTAFQVGGQKITNALSQRGPQVDPSLAQDITAAGQRRGVTTRRADVDPTVRGRRGQVQQTPQGREVIAAADASDLQEMETALVRELGGSTSRPTEAGEVIQGGVRSAREKLRTDAGKLYTLAHNEAGGIAPPARSGLREIDNQIADLQSQGKNLNKSEVAYLNELKEDLQDGLTIKALRAQRTGLRQKLQNRNLYSSDFERRVGEVYNAVSSDIEAGLANNPAALARYKEADKLWQQQAKLGEDVGDALLGRTGDLGAGQAADKVMLWARKDPARMNRLLEEVPDDVKDEVRALVAGQLGRSTNNNFSLAQFLTATSDGRGSKISPAAMRALFGKEGVEAIKDLRLLAQAKTDAADARNYSNTGGLVEKARNSFRRLILGGIGFGAASDAGTGIGLAAGGAASAAGEFFERLGRDRTLRLVLNPDFTGWLRRLPDTNQPGAINKSLSKLRSIASRTPGMTADIQAFEKMLLDVANDNASRVAAEPEGADEPRQANQ